MERAPTGSSIGNEVATTTTTPTAAQLTREKATKTREWKEESKFTGCKGRKNNTKRHRKEKEKVPTAPILQKWGKRVRAPYPEYSKKPCQWPIFLLT